MRKTFWLVFYVLLLAHVLFGRATQHADKTFAAIMPVTDIVAHSLQKETMSAPTQQKSSSFLATPNFVVKLFKPKKALPVSRSKRRTPLPEAKTLEDFKLPKIKPSPNENRTPFRRKDTDSSRKKVCLKRNSFELDIRRTELSDAELHRAFKAGKLITSGAATGITTSEYLYCKDCVIQIIQEKAAEPVIFDVSDEFTYEPDTNQELYNLVVDKTTDTDEELLLNCQSPAPITETILVPGKKTWYGKQTYTRKDVGQIQFEALNYPGKIFLRNRQFLTIAVDDAGYCFIKPISSSNILVKGYTILYR